MKSVLRLSALSAAVHASSPAVDPVWKEFLDFKRKFSLEFESLDEETHRFSVFKHNKEKAKTLTQQSGGRAQFGVTKFSHLTAAEFKKRLGYKKSETPKKNLKYPNPLERKPVKATSIDWRDTPNAVTPVKDQGQCGSCWAFSAAQAIETGFFKSTGSQRILAPQQIVSCDDQDYGCQGGNTGPAYDYVEQAGGLEPESDYPYRSGTSGMNGRCKSDPSEFAVSVTNYHTVSQGADGESAMMEEIQTTPLSICVDAESWQLYMGGVVDRSTCGTSLDHCVYLVGMKADDYWIVKNSWAADWGEEGYIRVKTGENACGIAEDATYVDAEGADTKKKEEVYV